MTYYKITNEHEKYYGFKFHDGLNIFQEREFAMAKENPFESELMGGLNIFEEPEYHTAYNKLYFTDINNIHKYLHRGICVREVILPTDDPNFMMVQIPDKDEWVANRIILGQCHKLSDINTFKMLKNHGMRIYDNDICTFWAHQFGHRDIFNYLFLEGNKMDLEFSHIPDFGRESVCEIARNGYTLIDAHLMIKLPELPIGIKYKPSIIYHLIKNITIKIGRARIFSYNSLTLECIDKIHNINTNPVTDNKICYQIPISNIFLNIIGRQNCNDFISGGLLLGKTNYYRVDIIVKFGDITDIVDNVSAIKSFLMENNCHGLKLNDTIISAKYFCKHDNKFMANRFFQKSMSDFFDIDKLMLQNVNQWNYSSICTYDNNNQIIISSSDYNIKINYSRCLLILIETIDDIINPDIYCSLSYINSMTTFTDARLPNINDTDVYCSLSYSDSMTTLTDATTQNIIMTKMPHMSNNNRIVYHCGWLNKNKENKLMLRIDNNKQNIKITCLIEWENIMAYEKGFGELLYEEPFVSLKKI